MDTIKTVSEYNSRKLEYEKNYTQYEESLSTTNLLCPMVYGLAGTMAGGLVGGSISILFNNLIKTDRASIGIAAGGILLGAIGATIAGIVRTNISSKEIEQELEKELNYLKQFEETHKNELEISA